MDCPICHVEVREGRKFCNQCGPRRSRSGARRAALPTGQARGSARSAAPGSGRPRPHSLPDRGVKDELLSRPLKPEPACSAPSCSAIWSVLPPWPLSSIRGLARHDRCVPPLRYRGSSSAPTASWRGIWAMAAPTYFGYPEPRGRCGAGCPFGPCGYGGLSGRLEGDRPQLRIVASRQDWSWWGI